MADDHHHYLTHAYLKGFAIPQPGNKHAKLWAVNGNGKCYQTTPKDAAKIQNYYSVPKADNPRGLEEWFSKIEAGAALYLYQCAAAPRLPNAEEREKLIEFVAIHLLRVPHMRTAVQQFTIDIADKMLAELAARPDDVRALGVNQFGMTGAQADELVKDVQMPAHLFKTEVANNSDLSPLLGAFDEVYRTLTKMRLHLLRGPEAIPFITGDRPVCVFAPGVGLGDPGLTHPDVEVTFSLNRRACLLLCWPQCRQVVELNEVEAQIVNNRVTAQSRRLLLGPIPEQLKDLHSRRA